MKQNFRCGSCNDEIWNSNQGEFPESGVRCNHCKTVYRMTKQPNYDDLVLKYHERKKLVTQ